MFDSHDHDGLNPTWGIEQPTIREEHHLAREVRTRVQHQRRPFEPIALTDEGIDDVYLHTRVRAEIGNGAR